MRQSCGGNGEQVSLVELVNIELTKWVSSYVSLDLSDALPFKWPICSDCKFDFSGY